MLSAVITAVVIITAIALAAGIGLSAASRSLPANKEALVDAVNNILPQTQCAQCGYPGCRPYAAAVVDGDADINLCPPGGSDTVARLAELFDREAKPVSEAAASGTQVALIDESLCIGCMHCRDACPVDAMIGAQQYMHTVIASECTGCELCIAPCPVDCISLRVVA